jgi:hypothetical protein
VRPANAETIQAAALARMSSAKHTLEKDSVMHRVDVEERGDVARYIVDCCPNQLMLPRIRLPKRLIGEMDAIEKIQGPCKPRRLKFSAAAHEIREVHVDEDDQLDRVVTWAEIKMAVPKNAREQWMEDVRDTIEQIQLATDVDAITAKRLLFRTWLRYETSTRPFFMAEA